MQSSELSSTRPYLIRAWHEWCCDNGLTPYINVAVDESVQVPREYVKDGEIVLNVGYEATTGLRMGNDYLEFKARFSGAVREVMVPVDQVLAIFARENSQGITFPNVDAEPQAANRPSRPAKHKSGGDAKQSLTCMPHEPAHGSGESQPKTATRPTLTRVK